jgi:hemerythrin
MTKKEKEQVMKKIEWNESYSLGIELIDEQHKGVMERFNDISIAIDKCQGEHEITKTLDYLIRHAESHFILEEKYMIDSSFPELEKHAKDHERFRFILNDLEEDFEEEGSTKNLAEAISTFLINGLITHIQGPDQKLARFLARKGFLVSAKVKQYQ